MPTLLISTVAGKSGDIFGHVFRDGTRQFRNHVHLAAPAVLGDHPRLGAERRGVPCPHVSPSKVSELDTADRPSAHSERRVARAPKEIGLFTESEEITRSNRGSRDRAPAYQTGERRDIRPPGIASQVDV